MDCPPGWTKLTLRSTMTALKEKINGLIKKCEVVEGHMRRRSVRIVDIPVTLEASSTAAVANLFSEVLQLDQKPLIDRPHRMPSGRKPGDKPRVTVAKLQFYLLPGNIMACAQSQPTPLQGITDHNRNRLCS